MTNTTTTIPDLANEVAIVWLEDIDRLEYVREEWVYATSRKGKPPIATSDRERLVGYTELGKGPKPIDCGRPAGSRLPINYNRRVFTLMSHDRDGTPTGYKTACPCEAVDPRTVAPGVAGVQTERCWGGKFPSPKIPANRAPRVS